MNFIFVSPHFPNTYWNFCDRLHRNGVNVLGIGDAPFDEIPGELKHCLTEYYRVDNLGSYEEMLRAVAYFTFHYGKIDWIESNNCAPISISIPVPRMILSSASSTRAA